MFGFSTAIARFPDSGHLIVLLNNAGGAPLDNMTDEGDRGKSRLGMSPFRMEGTVGRVVVNFLEELRQVVPD